ncbi:DUF4837 family protein [Paludibacter sp. 221]|uniref:DUF4837 family protein n=1 Tax=Paludibacter sp. 221 TaxID=2302939 RepID=UPI0013D6F4D7|nr:DUF4837 family protein [Paludibacter sp. 221]NDV46775.1 DUF4837 family protein [Paludibacter sp. 221]
MKTKKSTKKTFKSLFVSTGLLLLLAVGVFSCKNSTRVLPSATGARFELLVVMDNNQWKEPVGRAVFDLFDQDTPGLPQSEPMMKINQVRPEDFSDILKPSRNILYTEISERYTQPKIVYSKDYYAYPQCFVRVVAPNEEEFIQIIEKHGEEILNYFIASERERTIMFNKKDLNKKAVKEVEDLFGIQVDIPVDLKLSTIKDNFYWITNNSGYTRQDLIIYTYPYTDPNTFTYEFLTAKRDSVMKHNIPGEVEGSYVGTEYKYARPVMRAITVNGEYAAEIRGLWKVLNGGSMGGPYYSITRLDEINQRVVTIEGFVFAPATNKRNAIRALEAVAHSMKLPQDINVIGEVSVTAPKATGEEK